jgi:hypothetical protein
MPPPTIRASLKRLAASKVVAPQKLAGCSAAEIADLEAALNLRLPRAYRTFLSNCGKGAGDFLCGTDWEYKDIPQMQLVAKELLKESAILDRWTQSHFAFTMHQGYNFLFFDCTQGQNPPVWLFYDGTCEQVRDSFTIWLDGCVDDEIANYVDRGHLR